MGINIGRALIVEDNPQMRSLITLVLGAFGAVDIREAFNGAQAIDLLKEGGTDIIVMDWKMDVMDGMECTRAIRAGIDGCDPQVPIILLTGISGKDAEDAAYAAGCNLFVEKPFSLKKLYAAVAKVLGGDAAKRIDIDAEELAQ